MGLDILPFDFIQFFMVSTQKGFISLEIDWIFILIFFFWKAEINQSIEIIHEYEIIFGKSYNKRTMELF